jgi:lipopolysaccharide export system permease protein
MSILDKYIIKAFAINYMIALCVLMSMYVVLDLYFNFDEFTQDGALPMGQVIKAVLSYYTAHLFLYFAQISGVITLFAMAVTLARLQRSNEFVAIVASGVSLYRIALTVILTGIVLNGLWWFDQEFVIPRLAPQLAQSHQATAKDEPYGVWFVRDAQDWLWSARQFDQDAQELRGVVIMRAGESRDDIQLIEADLAAWEGQADGGVWRLQRGVRYEDQYDSRDDRRLQPVPIEVMQSDLHPDEIAMRQASNWIEFLSRAQLTQIKSRGTVSWQIIARAIHNRFTTPIVNMFILMIGIPLFLDRQPHSVIKSGGRCLMICGICFLLTFFSQNMVSLDHPTLTAWLPLIVLTPTMVVMLDRMRT